MLPMKILSSAWNYKLLFGATFPCLRTSPTAARFACAHSKAKLYHPPETAHQVR